MGMKITGLVALAITMGGCSSVDQGDPVGFSIDPPPAPLTGMDEFARNKWVVTSGCSADRCGAGYNADPLFLSAEKSRPCCGEAGYSLQITGSIRGCSATNYYLVWSEKMKRMPTESRATLLSRHAKQIAVSLVNACHLPKVDATIADLPRGLFE